VEADGSIFVRYNLNSPLNQEVSVWFGSELNFTLLGNVAQDFYYDLGTKREGIASFLNLQHVKTLSAVSAPAGFSCSLTFNPSAQVWAFPVETVSQSEGGLERTYQGSSLTAHWRLTLNPETGAETSVRLKPA